MIIRDPEELITLCQCTARDLAARFYPGLRVKVELDDLPLSMLGFACRGFDAGFNCQIVLDRIFIVLCSNGDYLEGIKDLILHEITHCQCINRGNSARIDSGFHGSQFAGFCRKIGAALGFPHPVYSHNTERKRRKKYVHDCKYWPHNQRPVSRFNDICKARRAALLRPVATGTTARTWGTPDAEAVLEAFHTIVETIDALHPHATRECIAGIVRARGAVQSIAARLTACGLLPVVPVDTWGLTEPKPETDDDKIRREIEALTNGY